MALSVKLDLAMAHTSWAGAPLPGLRARPLPEGEMTCGLPTQRRSHLSRAAGEVAVSAAGGGRLGVGGRKSCAGREEINRR